MKIGKKLFDSIVEINKWLDYYCKNHPKKDGEIAVKIFYELGNIFNEYAEFKRKNEPK